METLVSMCLYVSTDRQTDIYTSLDGKIDIDGYRWIKIDKYRQIDRKEIGGWMGGQIEKEINRKRQMDCVLKFLYLYCTLFYALTM